eukprot:4833669-Prymnesium_polylepis.1
MSKVLSFRTDEPEFDEEGAADVVLADGWRFIHGGDSCDKGGLVGGSIRVVQAAHGQNRLAAEEHASALRRTPRNHVI